jgi:hypothetical protein
LLLSLIAVVCYLIGAAWLGFSAYRSTSHAGHGGRIGALAVATLGACIHLAAMLGERRLEPDAAMSLGDTAAMIGFVIGLIGIGLALRPRGLGIAALLIAVAAFLEAGFTTGPRHFAVGRPVTSTPRTSRPMGGGLPESIRPRRAPDDDPEFLRKLDEQARKQDEEMLRRWEADLRQREEKLRREDGTTGTPPEARPEA